MVCNTITGACIVFVTAVGGGGGFFSFHSGGVEVHPVSTRNAQTKSFNDVGIRHILRMSDADSSFSGNYKQPFVVLADLVPTRHHWPA